MKHLGLRKKLKLPLTYLGCAVLLFCTHTVQAEIHTLVEFGYSPESTVTPYKDWQEVIYHPQNMTFVGDPQAPENSGLSESASVPSNDYTSTYAGIKGATPIQFKRGDKVIATFYNQTDYQLRLQARISFKDDDAPNADAGVYADWSRPWNTMYAENIDHNDFVQPHSYGKLIFNITDEHSITAPNALPTEGAHSLINISMDPRYNAWHGAFVLTKLEYSTDADITPPSSPSEFKATLTSNTEADIGNTVVELSWLPSQDAKSKVDSPPNSGVNRYMVYRDEQFYAVVDQEWIQHSMKQHGRIVYHDASAQAGEAYHYQVSAIDAAVTGHYRTPNSNIQFGNESAKASANITIPDFVSEQLIVPEKDIKFVGAFRLPRDYEGQTSNWQYAAMGLAYYPQGNSENSNNNSNNELPGSLFGIGHPHAPQLSEVSIPKPIVSNNPTELRRARRLQNFSNNIWPQVYNDNWKPQGGGDVMAGITYHPGINAETEGLYYSIFNTYSNGETKAHGMINLSLNQSQGAWHLGGLPNTENYLKPALTDRYLITAPQSWANSNTQARSLLVGQGYQSGVGVPSHGPTLFAIAPWETTGRLPADGDVINATTLLRYGGDGTPPNQWLQNWSLTQGYSGAAWLKTQANKQAVVFALSRPLGDAWYGGIDGTVTFTSDLDLPMTRSSSENIRGPMATEREASFYFYNPDDLAKVAAGIMQPWEPQPYLIWDFKKDLIAGITDREPNIGAIAFDAENGFLYMIQASADTTDGTQGYNKRSLVYVWKVGDIDNYTIEYGSPENNIPDEPAPNPPNEGPPIENLPIEDLPISDTPSQSGFPVIGSTCHFDIDGNGIVNSETDGYLLYRYMNNQQGENLIKGRIGENATRNTARAITNWLNNTFDAPNENSETNCHLDIDGDGITYAQTDGLIAYRYMQGLRHSQLTNGIVAANAGRQTLEEILNWLNSHYGQPARSCHLDADGDGLMHSETDGYLLYRYLDNYQGEALIQNRVSTTATRTDAQSITDWLDNTFSTTTDSNCNLDVDGDGIAIAGTDGALLHRFLEGKQGSELINGVVSANATRQSAEEIHSWMLENYVGQ